MGTGSLHGNSGIFRSTRGNTFLRSLIIMGSSSNSKKLIVMVVLTSSYFLVELIIGYLYKSLSLVADSFHMLSDVASLIIGLVSIKVRTKARWWTNFQISKRLPSHEMTYGYRRAQIVGGLVNGVFLLALCFSITMEALERFLEPQRKNISANTYPVSC